MHTTSKVKKWHCTPSFQLSFEKWNTHYAPLLAMSNPLHSITNQELFKKHLCNRSSHYEIMDHFHDEGKPSRITTKSTFFAVNKDKWDTNEDTGNEEYIVCTAVFRKARVQLKQC